MEKLPLGKRISLFLSSIGPGLFLIGYNIGTGSVTTMAKAGMAIMGIGIATGENRAIESAERAHRDCGARQRQSSGDR